MPALPTQYALMRRWVEWPAIDDIAMIEPPPLARHRGRRVLDAQERADDVEVERRLPRVDVGVDDRTEVQ